MILVDTSIWIDHFHLADEQLIHALGSSRVCCHPVVIEELALGSLARRTETLDLLGNLQQLPILTHGELLVFVEANRLWGRGLSPSDAHVLGSTKLAGARVWTRDKRLRTACLALDAAYDS